ncbi:MAG: endonuclease/exonuclease/phosphatase family protein [Oribacterium sp.]|nr:endonuclease/exonuclease/phosphatase family protein [Oribacterium sp.]
MRIATWNVERLQYRRQLSDLLGIIDKQRADILVLTETSDRLKPFYQHTFWTPKANEVIPDLYDDRENRVTIFSDYPSVGRYETFDQYTAICVGLETPKGILTVYGTIMGVFGNREKTFILDLEK